MAALLHAELLRRHLMLRRAALRLLRSLHAGMVDADDFVDTGRRTRCADRLQEARVRSTRGAVLALRSVRFPEPPPAPDMRLSTHPALHKPR
jgi:hypothetical protein